MRRAKRTRVIRASFTEDEFQVIQSALKLVKWCKDSERDTLVLYRQGLLALARAILRQHGDVPLPLAVDLRPESRGDRMEEDLQLPNPRRFLN